MPQKNPQKNIKIIHGITIFAITFILLLFVTKKYSYPKIAVFDLKKTYAIFLRQASNMSQEKQEILAKKFPKALQKAVDAYAQKNHEVVLVKNAVISGAEDITPEIQALIAGEMQKNA